MTKGRLEAFSDGVIAILITIMVLELRPPDGISIGSIHEVLPNLLAYLLSFMLIGIYWNNHHHLFQVVERIDSSVLWANMALLFSLSLVSPVTAWFGEHPMTEGPVFWYSVVQLLCAISYYVMTKVMLRIHAPDSPLAVALGSDRKGTISAVVYLAAIPLALVAPWASITIIAGVALVWLVPDRRMTKVLR